MRKPRFCVDITGEQSPLEAHAMLTLLSDDQCIHELHGLRLPLGIYNISVSRVTDKVMRLCSRLEEYFNAPDTLDPQNRTHDNLLEIIDYIELSLYAAAEHVDDITSIATGFFKHTSFRDKNPAYRALLKALKQHKQFIASAANAIKHQQSRIRVGSIPYEDEAHSGVLHGYFIEGVANGVVSPNQIFHKSNKLFSITSLAWEILVFLLLVSRDLLEFLLVIGAHMEGPVKVSCHPFARAAVAAARLPIYGFGEPHPFGKATVVLNAQSDSLEILDSGIYGSIRNGWSPVSNPEFGHLTCQYEGDGKTKCFEFFRLESVSFQRWD